MEERQSRLSSMVWRRLRPYFCVRLILLNSMFSNFCHVLKEAILNEFGDWMSVNKEAIYDTRPWKVFGEGPIANADIKINAQGFNEGAYTKATASEIRFTQTKKYLYATVLAWPEEKQVVIQSLATGSELYPDKITKIELLGYGKVSFTRTAQGVVIDMPDVQLNKIAPVFKIKK